MWWRRQSYCGSAGEAEARRQAADEHLFGAAFVLAVAADVVGVDVTVRASVGGVRRMRCVQLADAHVEVLLALKRVLTERTAELADADAAFLFGLLRRLQRASGWGVRLKRGLRYRTRTMPSRIFDATVASWPASLVSTCSNRSSLSCGKITRSLASAVLTALTHAVHGVRNTTERAEKTQTLVWNSGVGAAQSISIQFNPNPSPSPSPFHIHIPIPKDGKKPFREG